MCNIDIKRYMRGGMALLCAISLLCACGGAESTESIYMAQEESGSVESTEASESSTETSDKVANASEMTTVEEVVQDWMTPIYGSSVKDGEYDIKVDCSSSMFVIDSTKLIVENGEMTAVMTMGGKGYLYLYMGTGEEAVRASEAEYISYVENADGAHTYTIPVEALDAGIAVAAYSKNKEKWYDRTLVFRADSLPLSAMGEGYLTTAKDLGLKDGEYIVEVTLSGGSGKASVESPAKLVMENGEAFATIIFSSPNYDYMIYDDVRYEPINTEGNSTFEIPIAGFDRGLSISADTTAMGTPHLIDYTLTFDSESIENAN